MGPQTKLIFLNFNWDLWICQTPECLFSYLSPWKSCSFMLIHSNIWSPSHVKTNNWASIIAYWCSYLIVLDLYNKRKMKQLKCSNSSVQPFSTNLGPIFGSFLQLWETILCKYSKRISTKMKGCWMHLIHPNLSL